jgi:hypothetical protein
MLSANSSCLNGFDNRGSRMPLGASANPVASITGSFGHSAPIIFASFVPVMLGMT